MNFQLSVTIIVILIFIIANFNQNIAVCKKASTNGGFENNCSGNADQNKCLNNNKCGYLDKSTYCYDCDIGYTYTTYYYIPMWCGKDKFDDKNIEGTFWYYCRSKGNINDWCNPDENNLNVLDTGGGCYYSRGTSNECNINNNLRSGNHSTKNLTHDIENKSSVNNVYTHCGVILRDFDNNKLYQLEVRNNAFWQGMFITKTNHGNRKLKEWKDCMIKNNKPNDFNFRKGELNEDLKLSDVNNFMSNFINNNKVYGSCNNCQTFTRKICKEFDYKLNDCSIPK